MSLAGHIQKFGLTEDKKTAQEMPVRENGIMLDCADYILQVVP